MLFTKCDTSLCTLCERFFVHDRALDAIPNNSTAVPPLLKRHFDLRKKTNHHKQAIPIANMTMNTRSVRIPVHGEMRRQTTAATPQIITIQRATRSTSSRPFASAFCCLPASIVTYYTHTHSQLPTNRRALRTAKIQAQVPMTTPYSMLQQRPRLRPSLQRPTELRV